jgi:hypothetical protein
MLSYTLNIISDEVVCISESYYDDRTKTVDLETAYTEKNIPDWQRERIQETDQDEEGFGSRFIAISSLDSHEAYRDLEAFFVPVRNLRLQERLERTISGRGAFRYFKIVLLDDPAEREGWFAFRRERLQQRIHDGLATQDIVDMD